MSEIRIPPWIEFGLKYWKPILGIGAVLVSVIVFLATLNPRLQANEKQIKAVDEEVDDLKGWAREVQGYTRAMQQQQLMPNQMQRPSPPSVWREQTSDGAWYCTDGVDAWWPDDRRACE